MAQKKTPMMMGLTFLVAFIIISHTIHSLSYAGVSQVHVLFGVSDHLSIHNGKDLYRYCAEAPQMTEGKKEFYKKVEAALKSQGYTYYDGDRDIPGKGKQHANKPDFIAIKDNKVYIGEIKSPAEGPKSASWRQIQNSDTEHFKAVRTDVAKRERAGLLSPEIGGHEIIIRGQIADYVRKIGINFDLPASVSRNAEIRMAYSFPKSEEQNVEKALTNCRKRVFEKIDTGNGAVTYLFKGDLL